MTDDARAVQAQSWQDRALSRLLADGHREQVAGRFERAARARLELTAGQRVLDAGCGSGARRRMVARGKWETRGA